MRNLLFATGLGLCCAACTLPPEPAISSVTTTVPPDAPNCQDYTAQVTVDGSTQPIAGRACKQDDGTWQIVESVPGASPTVALYTPPPVAYQAFYDPWLWGPPLGFSTGGFLFLDKHHHVHRFHDHAPFAPHHPSFNVNAARIFLKTAEVNFPSVGGQPLARSWLFFGGRPRRLGIGAGVGGAMTALERTCSGINSACCRSR